MASAHSCSTCGRQFQWGADADSEIVDRQGMSWKSCRENAHWKLFFHFNEAHPEQTMLCPRRGESAIGAGLTKRDFWHVRDHHCVCSYCGSMHPDELFAAIEAGVELGPTDKSYKLYVSLPHPDPAGQRIVSSRNFPPADGETGWIKVTEQNRHLLRESGWTTKDDDDERWFQFGSNGPTIHAKFYFQHLDDAQQQRFVDLYNAKKLNIGVPGYFYAMPFFMRRAAAPTA